jgi:hypothetical protein
MARHGETDRRQREGIYFQVPTERRLSLEQAVNLLVEKEKVGDWKGVYALIDKPLTESEESFRKKNESLRRLRGFRPSKVTFIPPNDSWSIEGCAAFAGDLDSQGRVANLHAHWRQSRWYLSTISLELFGSEKGGDVRKCSMQQAGRPS